MDRISIILLFHGVSLFTFAESQTVNFLMRPKIVCNPNPEFVTNVSCVIKVIGREKYRLNMDCDLVKPLKNVSVTGGVYRFYNGYRLIYKKLTFNACDVLARRIYHPLTNLVLKFAPRFSNVNHTCPYSGHIFVRNAEYTPGMVSIVLPSGKYKLHLNVTEGYPPVSIGTVECSAELEERPFKI